MKVKYILGFLVLSLFFTFAPQTHAQVISTEEALNLFKVQLETLQNVLDELNLLTLRVRNLEDMLVETVNTVQDVGGDLRNFEPVRSLEVAQEAQAIQKGLETENRNQDGTIKRKPPCSQTGGGFACSATP